jgi:transcriptional regulator with GAF, ATPase, and Fis domain
MIESDILLRFIPQLADAPEALDRVTTACTSHTVAANRMLVREGDEASFLLGIASGEVDILRPFGDSLRTISRVGPDTLMGEAALVTGLRRTASVRSHSRVTWIKIPADAFRTAMLASPAVTLALMEQLMNRLQRRDTAYLEALRQSIVNRDKELAELRLTRTDQSEPDGVWSPSMEPVLDLALRLARSDLPVLILGESGTGKELMARYIHRHSERTAQDLRSLNCAAIPSEIAEAELFGARKGAFTGATRDRIGLLKAADGGTLFLDEIGDLPLAQQAKLLRALQDGTFYPVGSQTQDHSDVRLVSATNKDLRAEVAAGRFREDLMYRIDGARVTLPPLRERRDHIPILVKWVVEHAIRDVEPTYVTQDILPTLLRYTWPGNVRELVSVLKAALVLAEDFPRLRVSDLPEELVRQVYANSDAPPPTGRSGHKDQIGRTDHAGGEELEAPTRAELQELLRDRSLNEYLRDVTAKLITNALEAHDWVRKEAAQSLGMTPQNLSNYIRRMSIPTKPPHS